jgi:hypothetical protein
MGAWVVIKAGWYQALAADVSHIAASWSATFPQPSTKPISS